VLRNCLVLDLQGLVRVVLLLLRFQCLTEVLGLVQVFLLLDLRMKVLKNYLSFQRLILHYQLQ